MAILRPSGPVGINWGSPQARGLVSLVRWPEETVNTTWYSTSRLTTTLLGGHGLGFDGTHYATLPDAPRWALGGDFTLSFWFWANSNAGAPGIIDKVRSDQANPAWSIHIESGGGLKFQPKIATWPGLISTVLSYPTPWTFAAVRRSGTTVQWYLHGRPDTSAGGLSDAMATNVSPVYLGRRNDGGVLTGGLAHIAIHSRALSDQEILALYHPTTRWDLYAPSTPISSYFFLQRPEYNIPVIPPEPPSTYRLFYRYR